MDNILNANPIEKKSRQPHYKAIYFILFAVFTLAFLVTLVITKGTAGKFIFFQDYSDTFMDSLNSIIYNEVDPYENHVIYPPLACLFYKLCNKIIPLDDYYAFVTDPSKTAQSDYLRVMQGFLFPLILFMLFMGLLTIISIDLTFRGRKYEKALFMICVLFSTPMLFAIERGNNLLIPLACSLFFIGFYDSKNKVLREIALISLSVAVGFKLYPALFAIVLLCEKKWVQFARVVAYCIITTIVPFFIFYNGLMSMKLMITSITGFSSKKTSNIMNFDASLDFKHIFIYALNLSKRFTGISMEEPGINLVSNIARYGMALICGLCAIFVREKWKKTLFVSAIIYGFPGSCSTYLLLFFIIPIIFLFNEEKKRRFSTYIYLILLCITQLPIMIPHHGTISRYMPTKLSSAAVGLLCLLGFCELILILYRFIIKQIKARKGIAAV